MYRVIAVGLLLGLAVISTSAAVETFVISNEGWTNAEMAYMEPGRLFLKAEGLDERNRPQLVLGVSTDLGQTWSFQRMPMVEHGYGTEVHVFEYAAIHWAYSGTGVGGAFAKNMPIFYSDDGKTWGPSEVTSSLPDTTGRIVEGVQMGHAQARLMWAGGYELVAQGLQGKLWRSTDSGMYWAPVSLPGAAAGVIRLGGRAPDFTVYGWVHGNVLRLNPDGTVTMLPGLPYMLEVFAVCAPDNNRVVACWRGGSYQPANYWLSYSKDRGATWAHCGTSLSGSPHIDARGDLMLLANQSANPVAFDGTYLHMASSHDGTVHWTETLSGQRVLGVALVPPAHACALVVKSDPRYLYCVRRTATSTPQANRPPTVPTVRLRPRHPSAAQDVVCTASDSTDPDGDQVTYRYQWYKDEVLQPGLTQSTLAAKHTTAGERWTCVVTPSDGKVDGPSAHSSVRVEP